MEKPILQLYPLPSQERELIGTYLDHDVRQYSQETGNAFVYSNYITSLDGRIAVPHPSGEGLTVPKQTANERDWRLFQELAAQADLIISSGRYLREWAEGRAQEILQVDDPRFVDLRDWRESRGLPPQPDIAIISGSLRFPIPDILTVGGRKVVVFTSANPDPERVAEIEAKAGRVIVAGEQRVEGAALLKRVTELGYQTVYNSTGPKVLHLLLAGGVVDRLYLSYANRLLGGSPYATVVEGPSLEPAVDMRLNEVYFDPHAPDELGQLLVSYDCI